MCTFIEANKKMSRVSNNFRDVSKDLTNTILKKESITNFMKKCKSVTGQQLASILKQICEEDLPKDKQKTFFLTEVIPNMMLLETETVIRDTLVDFAVMFCDILSICELSSNEYKQFLKELCSKYIPAVSQLRDSNYQNWHKLWIFIVRFCDKKIHESMDLTNRLLRIVEYAFRNSSHEQRLKGYDCWKALIDNANLDRNHICSTKQIKLLITPLKAKFSKQEVVICKRFDIFVYLLEKLQDQAILALPEFLEFCFGPMGENKSSSRSGQAKSVPQIWPRSTKILISMLGHSHDQNVDCALGDSIFKGPLINKDNFHDNYKIIILSIGESCSLLKDDCADFNYETAIRCLWKSVFNLVIPSSESNRAKYFVVITNLIDEYIKQKEEASHYENLVVLIIWSLLEFDKDVIHDIISLILKQLLSVLLTIDTGLRNISTNIKQAISHSFSKVILEDNKISMIVTILEALVSSKISEANYTHFTNIWILVANEFTIDFTEEKVRQFSNFDEFFMWPSENLHRLEAANRKQMVLYWTKLYRKLTVDTEIKKLEVVKKLESRFKNNPLLSSNVTSLLNAIAQLDTKCSEQFATKIMELVCSILQLPNSNVEDEQKLSSLIIQHLEPTADYYNSENKEEFIKIMCTSIENLLRLHSGYKIIDPFVVFYKNCSIVIQKKFSFYLNSILLDLYNQENDTNSYNSKEISKCLALFNENNKEKEEEKKTFIVPTGRSARIAHMGKNSPTSPNRPTKNSLRLFGKDLETMSPLKAKGSQLNKSPVSKKKKGANVVDIQKKNIQSIHEENSEDFVPINSEVKIHINKLSNHQKEVLKTRRDDIPAMYQDLSQSVSQDMFSSKSNSKESADQEAQNAKPLSHPTETVRDSQLDMFSQRNTDHIIAQEEKDKNPSEQKQANGNVSSDLFSNKISSKASSENVENEMNSKAPKSPPPQDKIIEDQLKEADSDSRLREFERKKFKELSKLKMDIVGAEDFLNSPRRTREKKIKKSDETNSNAKSTKAKKNANKSNVEVEKKEDTQKSDTTSKELEGDASEPKNVDHIKENKQSSESLNRDKKGKRGRKPKSPTTDGKKKKDAKNTKSVVENKNYDSIDDKKKNTNSKKKLKPKKRSETLSKKIEDLDNSSDNSPTELKLGESDLETSKEDSKTDQTLKKVDSDTPVVVNDKKEVDKQRGDKRKQTDDENEDIIESSQESFVEIIPLLNSSKKKQLRLSIEKACFDLENEGVASLPTCSKPLDEPLEEINTTQDTTVTVTQDNSQDSVRTEDTLSRVSIITDPADLQSLKEVGPEGSLEPPKKLQLTESELITGQMDTMSVCSSKDTQGTVVIEKMDDEKLNYQPPIDSVEDILATSESTDPDSPPNSPSIPSSPVTADTPNRTNELLDSTMDISPITSRTNSEDYISDIIPVAMPINLFIDEEMKSTNEEVCGDGEDNKAKEVNNVTDGTENKEHQQQEETKTVKEEVEEEAQVFRSKLTDKEDSCEEANSSDEFYHDDGSSEAEMTPLKTAVNQDLPEIETSPHSSLQAVQSDEAPIQNGQISTTINIVPNRVFKEPSTIQDRASKIQTLIQLTHKTFVKRKCGATSSPSALRIKKLMNIVGQQNHSHDTVENFVEEDILTFSREIPSPLAVPASSILKRKFSDSSDNEGVSPCPKRKRVNFSDPCLTSKKIFIKDEYQPSIEAKRLFDITMDKKSQEENMNDIFNFPDDTPSSELSSETDSDIPETEPSLVVVNPMVLQKDKPIYPKLVDCKDDVVAIIKRITSPLFVPALMNKLKGKNIKTIGDLARLSEAEINRFPFKVPVVANVLKAFESYHKKKGDEEKSESVEEEEIRTGIRDTRTELNMLVNRATRENIPLEDLVKIVFQSVDPSKVVSAIRNKYPNIITDALEDKDYAPILKVIINSKGISAVLKRAHAYFHNDKREHEFYDGIADYVKYTMPLEKFFKGRSIEDLEVGIEESIKNKVFQRDEVIEHCLFRLLDTPKDIFPYLDTLSTVEIDEIVISRLKEGNAEEFIERILRSKPADEARKVTESLWIKQVDSPLDIINSFNKKIQSHSRNDVLVEMFKFCSDNLDVNTLLELHAGFLRRVSSALASKE